MGLLSFLKALFTTPDPAESQRRKAVEEDIDAALAAEAKRQHEEEERRRREEEAARRRQEARDGEGDTIKYSFRRKDGIRFSLSPKQDLNALIDAMPPIRPQPGFSEILVRLVHLRFHDDAPAVYRAAKLSRQAYSAIISDKDHQVTRNTALALAFALKLSEEEADKFLALAGYVMSPAKKPDIICRSCFRHGLHDIDTLNLILAKYDCPPLCT